MQVNSEVIDQMLKEKPDDVLAENALLKQLAKALLQYTLNTQSTPVKQEHCYPRFAGFDDKIVSMFARGANESGIRKRLDFIYGVDLGPALISEATAVLDVQLNALHNQRLQPLYPIVSLYTIHVEIAHADGKEQRAVHVPIGIDLKGHQQALGFWTSANQDESFWQAKLTGLRNQGVKDILLLCQDKVQGLPEALHNVYPQTQFHLNIFQLMQASARCIGLRDFKQLGADLKAIFRAPSVSQAADRLADFTSKCNGQYVAVVKLWKDNWERLVAFYALPDEIRRALSTMSAIAALHSNLRSAVRKRGSFPNQEEALKVLYAASQFGPKRWKSALDWKDALNQYEILWGDRLKSARVGRTILPPSQAAKATRTVQSDLPGLASASAASVDFPPHQAR